MIISILKPFLVKSRSAFFLWKAPKTRLLFFTGVAVGCLLFLRPAPSLAQSKTPPVSLGKDGHLMYHPDSRGNRIPDFSYAGYMAGNDTIPDVPVKVVVPLLAGDATLRIQAALNYVSRLPKDAKGIRGAVLLEKGRYAVEGRLKIDSSGVVLRGSGMDAGGTLLQVKGIRRETFIRVSGTHDRRQSTPVPLTDAYVPVGSFIVHVGNPGAFKQGERVMVHRPCTQNWIQQLDVVDFGGQSGWLGWKPGDEVVDWDRKITAIQGNEITLDAPLTTALDSAYGGATLSAYQWPGRISQVGIENLQLVSDYDHGNPKDEAHCWMAITLENVQDAWVRRVTFAHFAGSAVYAIRTSRRITVEDCKSLDPVSEIGGWRRYAFCTDGQQTLFQRLYSAHGYHDFAVGFCAAGPNAFVQCKAYLPYSYSGSIDSWASGLLFDNVRSDGGVLSFKNLGQDNHGAGWNAVNSVFWQCDASLIECDKPPTANNWAIGCWSEPAGHGYWGQPNEHVDPFSLYYAQLEDRLHQDVAARSRLLEIKTNASSSPTVQQAAELIASSVHPGPLLTTWIDRSAEVDPIGISVKGVQTIDEIGYPKPGPKSQKAAPMKISNGWLVRGEKILTGKRFEVPWWRGDIQPKDLLTAAPAVTRYVPGRTGDGLTDDLSELTTRMENQHVIALEQNYGLWYDRRRDDHERVRRQTGDVWPPFYELPFARSGRDTAWDGLSKYDLSRYNPWYWNRLKDFADLADQKGLVLVHQNYFQHNIIEAGAHWVDFPWRSANNINQTGFPEPPPFAGDKRIFMAQQFYDTANAVRRQLHIAFIRKCLANFEDNNGVIQLTAAEYTGPLHFVQFWLDVIGRWEKETGKKEWIGLSTTKDVQDSILADPARSALVNVIDIRQWHYQANGTLYAPQGGMNLAPRQLARLYHPKNSSFEQVYRAVSEYRNRYPDKAVIYSADNYDDYGWAVFMAGGSLAAIPEISDPAFLKEATEMKPASRPNPSDGPYLLSNPGKGYILYCLQGQTPSLDLTGAKGQFLVRRINPRDGKVSGEVKTIKGGQKIILGPSSGTVVIWVIKR